MVSRPKSTQSFALEQVCSLACNSDGSVFAFGSCNKQVFIWERNGLRQTIARAGIAAIYTVALSPDGQIIATGSESASMLLRSRDEKFKNKCKGDVGAMTSIAFSPDGKYIVAGRALWRSDGTPLLRKQFGASAQFKPDSASILCGPTRYDEGEQGVLLFERSLQGELIRTFEGAGRSTVLAVSSDGMLVAAGTHSGEIHLWDGKGRQLWQRQYSDGYSLTGLTIAPHGHCIASGGWGREEIQLWDRDGSTLRALPGYRPRPHGNGLLFLPNGRLLALSEQGVRLWNIDSGDSLELLCGSGNQWLVVDAQGRFDGSRAVITEPPALPGITLKARAPGLLEAFMD